MVTVTLPHGCVGVGHSQGSRLTLVVEVLNNRERCGTPVEAVHEVVSGRAVHTMEDNLLDEVIVGIYLKINLLVLNKVVLIIKTAGKGHHDTILDAIINTRTILVQTLIAIDGHRMLARP